MHSITDVINASTFSPLPDIGVSLTNTSMDERLYRFVK
ncbi:3-deoxy-7-phosphoheptulonate synthase, partial [Vibrio metschnikovii]|nr:3-deoxy-7-phosphoheptulonate synthase [Vibrio metschnikovii]